MRRLTVTAISGLALTDPGANNPVVVSPSYTVRGNSQQRQTLTFTPEYFLKATEVGRKHISSAIFPVAPISALL